MIKIQKMFEASAPIFPLLKPFFQDIIKRVPQNRVPEPCASARTEVLAAVPTRPRASSRVQGGTTTGLVDGTGGRGLLRPGLARTF